MSLHVDCIGTSRTEKFGLIVRSSHNMVDRNQTMRGLNTSVVTGSLDINFQDIALRGHDPIWDQQGVTLEIWIKSPSKTNRNQPAWAVTNDQNLSTARGCLAARPGDDQRDKLLATEAFMHGVAGTSIFANFPKPTQERADLDWKRSNNADIRRYRRWCNMNGTFAGLVAHWKPPARPDLRRTAT